MSRSTFPPVISGDTSYQRSDDTVNDTCRKTDRQRYPGAHPGSYPEVAAQAVSPEPVARGKTLVHLIYILGIMCVMTQYRCKYCQDDVQSDQTKRKKRHLVLPDPPPGILPVSDIRPGDRLHAADIFSYDFKFFSCNLCHSRHLLSFSAQADSRIYDTV